MLNNNENRYYLIERKAKELIKYLDIYTLQFPKHQKYVLGERIRNYAQDVLDLIITINKKHFKKTDWTLLDVRHEQLRVNVQLAYELGYPRLNTYDEAASKVDEIGKMIGAWYKEIHSIKTAKIDYV